MLCRTAIKMAQPLTFSLIVLLGMVIISNHYLPSSYAVSSVTPVGIDTSTSNAASLSNNAIQTLAITIGNNPNRLLVFGASTTSYYAGSGPIITVSSVQIGSVPFTKIVSKSSAYPWDAEIWYLVNPPTGNQIITVTYSQTSPNGATIQEAISLYNVDQNSPIGAIASGTSVADNPSVSIVPT